MTKAEAWERFVGYAGTLHLRVGNFEGEKGKFVCSYVGPRPEGVVASGIADTPEAAIAAALGETLEADAPGEDAALIDALASYACGGRIGVEWPDGTSHLIWSYWSYPHDLRAALRELAEEKEATNADH